MKEMSKLNGLKSKLKRKKKLVILLVIIIAAAIFAVVFFHVKQGRGGSGDEVYVDSVAGWMGESITPGRSNRFAGVAESQDEVAVTKSEGSEIKEILVEEGQTVEKGTPLFTYDLDTVQTDLAQAEIDLTRTQNEYDSIKSTIEELTKEKKSADSSEQASYTLQLQEEELALKQKELDLKSAQEKIDKIKKSLENETVVSEVDGVVKSVQTPGQTTGDMDYESEDESGSSGEVVMKISRTADMRIKGTMNELNRRDITEGLKLTVHSRVDDQTWTGTVEKIDITNGTETSQEDEWGESTGGGGSTNYPFYVKLDSGEGLMMGQHVYMEIAAGDGEKDGVWVADYLIDLTDEEHPFVWIDRNGRLRKQDVTLGEYDEEAMKYEVKEGLAYDDLIAVPEEELSEGMKTEQITLGEDSEEGFDEDSGEYDAELGDGDYSDEETLSL